MIARTWRGAVVAADGDAYAQYLRETGLKEYRETPGNRGAWMLRRERGDDTTEFLMFTLWDSMDAIRAFAGDDPQSGRYYARDDEFLIERHDPQHFDAEAG